MVNDDTVKLLKECNAGIKMGILSIDDVIDKVEDKTFKSLLNKCKDRHNSLGSETRALLNSYGDDGKEPNMMARSMSFMKTQVKTSLQPGDATIANLITDGCDMGVKSLNRYLNEYEAASEQVKDIAKRLVNLEEQLTTDIAPYL